MKTLFDIISALRSLAGDLEVLAEAAAYKEREAAPAPKVTLEEVRATLAAKSQQGHTAEVRALLEKYGAPKLSQIDPAHYVALLVEAEVLGYE